LESLDGVGKREGVVVIGATNMPEKLDPALLRPGRLGRHLKILLPDAEDRNGILRHHLGVDLQEESLSDAIAYLDGATGAVIEQVVRDARRRARHLGRKMTAEDLTHGIPRVRLSEDAFRRACIHESGHALVGQLLCAVTGNIPVAARVRRDNMVQQDDTGETEFYRIPGFDRTKASHLAEITTLLAGLAAEDIMLGGHGEGSGGEKHSDLHLATVLAARLEGSFGLGGSLVYLISSDEADVMEHIRQDSHLRRQIHAILKACAHRARTLISQNRETFEMLASKLAQQYHLTSADISTLIGETIRENVSSNFGRNDKDHATMFLSG
jgi:ATP-dependent Zn protease